MIVWVRTDSWITSIRGTLQRSIHAAMLDALHVGIASTNIQSSSWFCRATELESHAPTRMAVGALGTHVTISDADRKSVPGIIVIQIHTLSIITSIHNAFHNVVEGNALLVRPAWSDVHTLSINTLRAKVDEVSVRLALQRTLRIKSFLGEHFDHVVAPVTKAHCNQLTPVELIVVEETSTKCSVCLRRSGFWFSASDPINEVVPETRFCAAAGGTRNANGLISFSFLLCELEIFRLQKPTLVVKLSSVRQCDSAKQ